MSATETTVNNTTGEAPSQDAPSQVPAEVEAKSAESEGFRVYFGNLSYKTTEEEVREFASKSGGEILTVIIPQRFKRPSGFAFVHYKTEEEANKAVEQLNDQELEGRKVRLQVARSREEQAARRESIIAKRDAAREEREASKAAKKEKKGGENETEQEDSPKPKPKKRSAKKAPRRRVAGDESEDAEGEATEAAETTEAGEATEKKKSKPKKKSSKTKKAAEEARIDGDATDGAAEPKEKREKKPKAQRKLALTDNPSPHTIFVANLPFEVDDDALSAIFTNLSISVKSAKVVTGLRKPRNARPFRASRGFGFVEIEDSTQQKEAVEKVDGTLIGERKISAKIANEMKPVEENEVQAAVKEESEAAPAATAAA